MKFGKQMVLAALFMVSVFSAAPASADTVDNITKKLGRGVANVGFGPLEILIRPWDVNNESGGIAALTYGVFKGVVCVVVRECVGVAEIVTFPFPLPNCPEDPMDAGWGYGPILPPSWPEWVVDIDHNAYNFFYDDQTVIDRK